MADAPAREKAPANATGRANEKALPEQLSELWALITAYLRQETVQPLKGLGKWVGLGVAGAFLFGLGVIMIGVGGLRLLQTETDTTFTGNLSWIPYLIVFAALTLGGVVSLTAIGDKDSKKSKKQGRGDAPEGIPSPGRATQGTHAR